MEKEKSLSWSVTGINTFISCPRKYFFSNVLASNAKNAEPIRKQAYWLKKSVNFEMWAGNIVDTIMNTVIIPSFQIKEIPNFEEAVKKSLDLAREQFIFSKNGLYKQQNETVAGEKYCVLEIHENDEVYEELELLRVVEKIKTAILNIPKIKFQNGKLLVEYLMEAKWLAPNEQRRHLRIGSANMSPQIDLLMSHGNQQIVIDWKVADSKFSNYERQLLACGTVIYRKREQKAKEDGWLWDFNQIGLYEVNLYRGVIKEYNFNEEKYHEIVDLVSNTTEDIERLFRGRNPMDVPLKEYGFYRKEITCETCSFKHLCNFTLLNHDFQTANYREFIRVAQS